MASEEDATCEDLLQEIATGLSLLQDFVTSSKDHLAKKKDCSQAILDINNAVQRIILKSTQGRSVFVNDIKGIVKEVVAEMNQENFSAPPAPTPMLYSNVVKNLVPKPLPKKFKVLIYPNENCTEIKSSEETKNVLTKMNPKSLGIKADNIIKIRNNGLLVESSDRSILSLANNEEVKKSNLTVRVPNVIWPRIIVYDVPTDVEKDDLLNEIVADIPEEMDIDGDLFKQAFKFGKKQGPSCHWVVELHPKARSSLISAGKVRVGWKSCYLSDFIRITRCFKCQRFGHVASKCEQEQVCAVCTNVEHDTQVCPHKESVDKHRCINCIRAKKRDILHRASSDVCPLFLARKNDYIQSINYDT